MNTQDKMHAVLEQLEKSQELVEQNAVDAINGQDRVYNMLRESEGKSIELISNFEAVCYEIEETIAVMEAKYGEVMEPEDVEKLMQLCELVVSQTMNIHELGQVFQTVLDNEDQMKDSVHCLEEAIELHRGAMEEFYRNIE
ncbi:MAG: hypothetical protein E7256_04950 [Lachnospiraceae bacterium]|nr:hypothetical protein [Lachnospiraceae bacterium]